MSQENLEALNRFVDASNRRDVEAMLEELDAEVEWRSAILGSLRGEAAVFRGHDGVRELFRDLGDRLVAFGRWTTRGEGSGAETTAPVAAVSDFKDGNALRVLIYLDPQDALEAAGLRA